MQDRSEIKNLAQDGLWGHLRALSGLYSRETFLSLFGCVARMVRDYPMQGFVLCRTLGDPAFEALALSLESQPDVPLFRLDDPQLFETAAPQTTAPTPPGFLLVLTNRLCAVIFWSSDKRKTFKLYEGGWTFHPADTKTAATQLVDQLDHLAEHPILLQLLGQTPVDRRYDARFGMLINTLVNSLENRNRELISALETVHDLNQKIVESERLAAIGQLCSVIAHEIRNPLGLIDLYAKLTEDQLKLVLDGIRENMPTAEDIENVETLPPGCEGLFKNISLIRQSIGSLETILSELTQYSRPLTLSLEPCELVSLVSDVCDFYRPSFQEKGVRLQVSTTGPSEYALSLDTGRIRQALLNLLKNALEASSPESTVTVTVASRKADEKIFIKVKDEGAGIDPKLQPKLFTPYFSTKGNGTGLGLAHSRKILQAHGGGVELLASTPKKGTTMALILPKDTVSTSHASSVHMSAKTSLP